MNGTQNRRRGNVIVFSAVAGLAAAAVGVLGATQHDPVAAQNRDVALTNAADDAHNNLIDAQVGLDHNLYDEQIALQQSIYYWAEQNDLTNLLAIGDATDPSTNLLNGAFTRYSEALVVGQAHEQAVIDHWLGVNQTAGIGGVEPGDEGGSPGGYETAIGNALYSDLNGSGIDPDSQLGEALAQFAPDSDLDLTSYSDFTSALTTLQLELYQQAFSDTLGAFIPASSDAPETAADLFGGLF
jgi:hypothetical protein